MKAPTPLQSYLRHWQGDVAKLEEEFGVYSYEHPTLPLVGFKYDQIKSPKKHEIVRCSRGTVLEKNTWNLIAQPMLRFFNYGEDWEKQDDFQWNNCFINEKADGSLIVCYYYDGKWHANTSGSFGLGPISEIFPKPWGEYFWEIFTKQGGDAGKLYPDYTYCFELCSLWNKVVREYPEPKVYLLTATNIKYDPYELSGFEVEEMGKDIGIFCPDRYEFANIKEIEDYLDVNASTDPTYEGFVLQDCNKQRIKIKSKKYLTLHHLKGNGGIVSPKNILPWILTNDTEELLTYFKELTPIVNSMKEKVEAEWTNLLKVWQENWQIENQKEFALKIVPVSRFSGLLFDMRKRYGRMQTEHQLRALWEQSEDLIVKVLFK